MLIAWVNGARVEAARALERGQPFKCPGCEADVILKAGSIKIAHFAHKPGAPVCAYSLGETIAHLTAKKLFCEAARERGLRAEMEYPIGDQRADVAIWAPDGKILVIEIQHTPIEVEDLKRRVIGYRRKGLSHIWIPTLKVTSKMVGENGWIYDYSIRPFERYLNKVYGGLWMYIEPDKTIGFFEVKDRLIHHEGGQFGENEYPEYEYVSRRWKILVPKNVVEVMDIRYSFISKAHGVELFGDDDESQQPEEVKCDAETSRPERAGTGHWCGECGQWGSWGYPGGPEGTRWFCFDHRPADCPSRTRNVA